jgi:hypothetical protein
MKNRFIIFITAIFISISGTFLSCSDWNSPESLDIEVPRVEDENNALYQQYLENLRNYKRSYHQLLIGFFDNSNKTYDSRGKHLSSVPDKVDILSLLAPDSLTDTELRDINVLRNDKGTRIIYSINYDAIAQKIRADINEAEEEIAEGNTAIIVPDFFETLEKELDTQFALLSKYDYDGICLEYRGFSFLFPTVIDRDQIVRVQKMLFDRIDEIKGKTLLFAGYPEHIIDRSKLEVFDYIVLETQTAVDMGTIDVLVAGSLQAGVPMDRIVISAMARSLEPTDTRTGMFADGSTAIVSSARWMKTPGTFTKAGLAIYRINDDYYNPERDYKNTREAIEIMNPSAQK